MTLELDQLPPPESIIPSSDAMVTISTFWLVVPTLPNMSYSQLSDTFITYLYNHGYKIVKLEDRDLQ